MHNIIHTCVWWIDISLCKLKFSFMFVGGTFFIYQHVCWVCYFIRQKYCKITMYVRSSELFIFRTMWPYLSGFSVMISQYLSTICSFVIRFEMFLYPYVLFPFLFFYCSYFGCFWFTWVKHRKQNWVENAFYDSVLVWNHLCLFAEQVLNFVLLFYNTKHLEK